MLETLIRQATRDDVAELARLRWDFSPNEAAVSQQTFSKWSVEFGQFLSSALDSGKWTIWVVESNTRLIANIWVYQVPKVPRPGKSGKAWGM